MQTWASEGMFRGQGSADYRRAGELAKKMAHLQALKELYEVGSETMDQETRRGVLEEIEDLTQEVHALAG